MANPNSRRKWTDFFRQLLIFSLAILFTSVGRHAFRFQPFLRCAQESLSTAAWRLPRLRPRSLFNSSSNIPVNNMRCRHFDLKALLRSSCLCSYFNADECLLEFFAEWIRRWKNELKQGHPCKPWRVGKNALLSRLRGWCDSSVRRRRGRRRGQLNGSPPLFPNGPSLGLAIPAGREARRVTNQQWGATGPQPSHYFSPTVTTPRVRRPALLGGGRRRRVETQRRGNLQCGAVSEGKTPGPIWDEPQSLSQSPGGSCLLPMLVAAVCRAEYPPW